MSKFFYIAAVIIVAAITPQAVKMAESHRGYSGAFGGEWLLIPLAILIVFFVKEVINGTKEMMQDINAESLEE